MREIKFRVYAVTWKDMLYFEKLYFHRIGVPSVRADCINAIKRKKTPIGQTTACPEYTHVVDEHTEFSNIMQYTGLKDKNGVEIYEGDIVSEYFGEGLYKIIYGGSTFYSKGINNRRQHPISIDSEVIGNIYENPELLK